GKLRQQAHLGGGRCPEGHRDAGQGAAKATQGQASEREAALTMAATQATQAQSALPEVFGCFRIVEVLASRGMGLVYRAVETSSGREVAIKTVSMLQRERMEAIRSEIIALTRLHHPGVVTILDHGVDRGMPWYAMDLIEGDSLAQ